MNRQRDATVAWLEARDTGSPVELQRHVRTAIAATRETELVDALVDASTACLDSALRLGPDRAAATELLAADALLTWACEAAAESVDARALDAFLDEVAGRLQTLLEESE